MSNLFVIKDFHGNVRARVSEDGSVLDSKGNVVGFVNEDGSCGDDAEELLGEINQSGQAIDAQGHTVGYVDVGTGLLKEENNSTFCEIDGSGQVRDTLSSVCGTVEGFSFKQLKMLASYIFFFDKALIKSHLSSRVVETPAQDVKEIDQGIISKEEQFLEKLIPKSIPAPNSQEPETLDNGLTDIEEAARKEEERISRWMQKKENWWYRPKACKTQSRR
eukprot:TRINITY_DN10905_c0_g1_i1.p1 TRINITY_DN10905_c0_g1~~TRINITY_DN10905_c0_g1_i1.p1  ORF type:complete len:219 (+),score=45.69 TRINITY_DN10905_c0_g1_i1:69-725(+)